MTPQLIRLPRNDPMPNNQVLPILLYRAVLTDVGEIDSCARAFEDLFRRNKWPAQWRGGVFSYHHYHSTAHEVLGCAAGAATLVLGGLGGPQIAFAAGDVVVLPVGTGHRCAEATAEFLVVGAYPPGQRFDVCRSTPDANALPRMARLGFPDSDPVAGLMGPLTKLWRRPA